MDFLNKSLAQLSDLFRSMTPGARMTAGLLLAVVVVSMGYLFRQSASGPDAFLFGGEPLSDGQLTRAEAAIAQAGLSGYEREGNRIRVPAGQKAAYLAAVADGGALPPNFNTILEDALGKGGPWDSRKQTEERLKIAKQATLSEIVRAMHWVESAVVLYDEHESRELRKFSAVKLVSASVSVKPVIGETLTPQRAKNIQKLVAHAVNMQPSDVAVTNLGEGGAYGSDGEITADIFEDGSLMQTKVAFESQKRDSISKALRDIPGVRVEVNADFDATLEERTSIVKPDPKAVIQQESTTEEKSSQSADDNGGRPGVTANGPNRSNANATAQAAQSKNQNETSSKTSDTQSFVGVEKSETLKKSYTPKEVWATVAIPSSYIENLWKARNPTAAAPPKPDDLRLIQNEVVPKVENIVEPLLIFQASKGEDTYKHVRVVVLDSLPAPAITPPSFTSNATSWVGRYWSTLAMLGVAMFSLLVLRSVVNNKPGDAEGGAAAAAATGLTLHKEESQSNSTEADDEPENERPRLRLRKEKSLKDDLVEIVREDPDAAADILRSWIGKAG
jgi:flagellar M-ring protein FliF